MTRATTPAPRIYMATQKNKGQDAQDVSIINMFIRFTGSRERMTCSNLSRVLHVCSSPWNLTDITLDSSPLGRVMFLHHHPHLVARQNAAVTRGVGQCQQKLSKTHRAKEAEAARSVLRAVAAIPEVFGCDSSHHSRWMSQGTMGFRFVRIFGSPHGEKNRSDDGFSQHQESSSSESKRSGASQTSALRFHPLRKLSSLGTKATKPYWS